jgi:AraC-like DNA-binding protein
MDPLLDLLRAMNLTGGVVLDAELSAPWCVTSRVEPQDYGTVRPAPAHVVGYHYVIEGQCRLSVGGRHVGDVRAGEIVLVPRNDPHDLASGPDLPPVPARDLVQKARANGLPLVRHGGGGERTRLLCGFLGTSTVNPPIASVLPPALTIAVDDGAAAAWIESSFRFVAQELVNPRYESTPVFAKLAELLFIEAVRRHVASLPPGERGWLAGLRDPMVGRALALLHGQKQHRWTVPALAHEVGASRSAFADRFTTVMGETPMRYLTRQRLQRAAERLREDGASVADVAFDAGYESEAAFSRAFKRTYHRPPAAWRKEIGEA